MSIDLNAQTDVNGQLSGSHYGNKREAGCHQIVIVGGGAAGLELATKLGKKHGKSGNVKITLIDANLTHMWKPLLHEVAAGKLNSGEEEVSYLAHAHRNNFRFCLGRLESLDRAQQIVTMEPFLDEGGNQYVPRRRFYYDTLILAIGSKTNSFGTPGVEEHCVFLDSRNQADKFHQQLLRSFLRVQTFQGELAEKQLNVAIVGAGATGVELAAELHHTARELVEFGLDQIVPHRDVKIRVIEAGPRILPAVAERIATGAHQQLEKLGVVVHTNMRISKVTADGLHTADGEFIPAAIKVWAAGIKAADVLADLDGLESNRINQLLVKPTLQTTLDERIFALGDCAACPRKDSDRPVPPRAQAAHQQASLLAKSINCRLKGKPVPEYVYHDFGSLVSLSKGGAVGNLMGNLTGDVMVSGRIARVIYVSLYRMHLMAVHGVLRTGLKIVGQWLSGGVKPPMKMH
ncbi:NAD(P)/FAD-dependent oxidoreductase [Pseudomaricurvus alcaniphilus]|uniref:NAD(P)/FAD-dependent oxidoreductase n=1 Tax=Pseudomaricurvus alcaniphilus TaxID=1166482 RepID=UPI00140E43DE|nr:NAD(P)/FAD-dependent oxidoreductase [Pseudomaricurvus alcaniphilus]NHN39821.1 NAD(P)/FAD-dependent oxidoreductase [Pseudomaricurvus alcaniphilus]